METSANAVRFFGAFDFMSPAETGQALRYTLSLSALRSCPPRGTGCAYSLVMSKKTENLNTQSDATARNSSRGFQGGSP